MNEINDSVFNDIEFFDKIYPCINRTITSYGDNKLQSLFRTLYYHPNQLQRRRMIVETAHKKIKLRNYMRKKLSILHKLEKDISWLFIPESYEEIKDLYFKFNLLNKQTPLSLSNNLIIGLPLIYICVYLLIYILLAKSGINISIQSYLKMLYNSYKSIANVVTGFVIADTQWKSLVSNILTNVYCLFTTYSGCSFINNSVTHYSKCSNVKNKFNTISKAIKIIKDIYKKDILFAIEKTSIKKDLNYITKKFTNNIGLGQALELYKNKDRLETAFNNVLQYIGMVDSFISVSLLLDEGYTFPDFIYDSTTPFVNTKNVFHPLLDHTQQKNSLDINDKTIVLTGTNGSGKTTFMKSIVLAVVLAQTVGVCNCSNLTMSPYTSIITQFALPNQVGKSSLFEAELENYKNIFYSVEENTRCLLAIDELFTGTNPQDALASSYSIYKYLHYNPNISTIVSTHYHDILHQCKKWINMYYFNSIENNNTISHSYLISHGVCFQSNLIQTLEKIGIDQNIINFTKEYKEINK